MTINRHIPAAELIVALQSRGSRIDEKSSASLLECIEHLQEHCFPEATRVVLANDEVCDFLDDIKRGLFQKEAVLLLTVPKDFPAAQLETFLELKRYAVSSFVTVSGVGHATIDCCELKPRYGMPYRIDGFLRFFFDEIC